MVEEEHPSRTLVSLSAEGADVDRIRTAVNRVQPRISCDPGDLSAWYLLHNPRPPRVRLRVEDVEVGGPETRYDEVSPLNRRISVWTEHRAAGVPAEVMQFVPGFFKLHPMNYPSVIVRSRVNVHYSNEIWFVDTGPYVEGCDVGDLFRWRPHGFSWRRVEGRIRRQGGHAFTVNLGMIYF